MTELAPSGQTPSSATLTCPACQTTITYYDVADSSYYVCPNCHTFFKYEHEDPPEILASFRNTVSTLALPIGTEGYLNGQFVRVVGHMHKKEAGTSYDWSEYMLLQQNGRYVQLAEYQGHWTIIKPDAEKYSPFHAGGTAYYVDTPLRRYRLYNRYKVEVLNAAGEFDWNVLDDQQLTISEYIQPPYMLVEEEGLKRSDWYMAQYMPHTDVEKVFGLSAATLPIPYGVGAIEPADPKDRSGAVLMFTSMIIVAIIVIQVILSIAKPSRQLLSESYSVESDSAGNSKVIVTAPFTINGPTALNINVSAELNNQWLELPITLINEQSGRSYEVTKTLEYYSGVESGESWSEGSRDDDAVLARVPSGRYHLNMYPVSSPGQPVSFQVTLNQNTTLISNLIVLLLLLTVFPLVLYFRNQWYEKQRWDNSDFADREENG